MENWGCAGAGEPGQTVNLVLLAEWVRIQQPPPLGCLTEALDVASVKSFHFCGCSSVGRASAFQAEGRGFESRLPLHVYVSTPRFQQWEDICKTTHDFSRGNVQEKRHTSRCSSGVEHFHGKEGVGGSIPPIGSRLLGNVFFDYNFISKIRY